MPPPKDKPLPVIELTGSSACSGKTQLLYHLISLSLLPPKHQDVLIRGKGSAVVLCDLSSKFSVLRLHDIMHNHVLSAIEHSTISEIPIASLLSDSLTHLHIFRPHSTTSFLSTLSFLPKYLLGQPPSHFSTNRPLGLLIINNISTFLWQDRLDADEETDPSTSKDPVKSGSNFFSQRYRTLVSTLREIQRTFSCVIVATNRGLAPVMSVSGRRALSSYLPPIWNSFCTVKLVTERNRVRKFGPGLSIEEASKEAWQRWEAVERSPFTVSVNWADSEDWKEEVREAVRKLEVQGSFFFCVTDEGVMLDVNED